MSTTLQVTGGLQWDRYWVIAKEEDNKVLTQRTHPSMALIQPRLGADAHQVDGVWLTVPNQEDIWLTSQPTAEMPLVTILSNGGPIEGADLGDDVAQWISQYLGFPARIFVKAGKTRPVTENLPKDVDDRNLSPQTAFADQYPCLLISESSLQDLNGRLDRQVDMRRFRPNIVVAGNGEPFAEDTWVNAYLQSTTNTNGLYVANLCVRCILPNVDPDKGVSSGLEPLKTLQSYRRVDPKSKYKACFGVNLIPVAFGQPIAVGDTFNVLADMPIV